MSFGEAQGASLLGPLKDKTTTFLMEGRAANAGFARLLSESLRAARMSCLFLDLDAFYSSNADRFFLGEAEAKFTLRVPSPGADIEAEFSSLFEAKEDAVAIDSLNTLYHLISAEDGSSKGRKIMFAVASLSQLARANGKTVVMSMYRREGFGRSGKGRSISHLTDLTASVKLRDQRLEVVTEKGTGWSDGAFFSRIP
jgi:hypothetical protein